MNLYHRDTVHYCLLYVDLRLINSKLITRYICNTNSCGDDSLLSSGRCHNKNEGYNSKLKIREYCDS